MNEDNNNPQTPPVVQQPVETQPLPPPLTPPVAETVPPDYPQKPGMSRNKKIIYGLAVLLLIIAAGVSWWLLRPTTDEVVITTTQTKKVVKPAEDEVLTEEIDCGDRSGFGDQSIGMKFCYPAEWGTPSVLDAKLSDIDTGYRQVIKFADMPYVQMGGVSGDWSSEVGRDGICFDPTNRYPEVSSYNTSWQEEEGTGDELEFAVRSIAPSKPNFALTEEVSDVLQPGVCLRGIKEIAASNYRYGSISYYRDFTEASGITTPAQHVANPDTLLAAQMRIDIDALLTSLVKY